jgi:uncharacterized protein (DUF1015 family)
MAEIVPFKAIRPCKEQLQNFSSKSYKSYSLNEIQSTLKRNPLSFLSIIHLKKNLNGSLKRSERYQLVKNKFRDLIDEKILIKDPSPAFYIYETRQADNHLFCGVIAGASVEDYNNNVIKKHEATIAKRENTFKNYLKAVRFNAAPVLLTFADNQTINKGIQTAKNNAKEINEWTTENETHKIWHIDKNNDIEILAKAFASIPKLYIADGHHRSASSVLLAKEIGANSTSKLNKAHTHFLSYLIPESQLKIYDYNRLIKNLNGLTVDQLLYKINLVFEIDKKETNLHFSTRKNEICMYLSGNFYSLYLRKTIEDKTTAINQLDTQILQTYLLEPILGIENVRTDKRISYIYGKDSMKQIKTAVDCGEQAVGFGLFPIQINELKAIADSGAVMPPKSTYIYPKLRSGITIYDF